MFFQMSVHCTMDGSVCGHNYRYVYTKNGNWTAMDVACAVVI